MVCVTVHSMCWGVISSVQSVPVLLPETMLRGLTTLSCQSVVLPHIQSYVNLLSHHLLTADRSTVHVNGWATWAALVNMKLCIQHMHPRRLAVMLAKRETACTGGVNGVKHLELLSGDTCCHCKCLTTQARSGSPPSRYILTLCTFLPYVRFVTGVDVCNRHVSGCKRPDDTSCVACIVRRQHT